MRKQITKEEYDALMEIIKIQEKTEDGYEGEYPYKEISPKGLENVKKWYGTTFESTTDWNPKTEEWLIEKLEASFLDEQSDCEFYGHVFTTKLQKVACYDFADEDFSFFVNN